MCRHLAYVGPPEPVGELLTRGVHALRTQAWAPRDMRGGGTINADGFGVAWWRHAGHPGQARVSRYRNAAPIWTDPAVDEVLPQIESTAVLGAVRSATVGMPVERAACAPFIDDGWAFSHNGVVPNWRKALTAALADLDNAATRAGATRMFQTADLLDAESATDSAAMWVLLRGLLTPGAPP
ncbi:class II glutamine amidotransferase, partial [Nocardia cyriacigeorgica]